MKKLILFFLLLIPLLVSAQDLFNVADSCKWLMLPPNPQQEQAEGFKMPTAYFYNIPGKFRIELFDMPESDDMLQITLLDKEHFFDDSIASITYGTGITYCNIPYITYDERGGVDKKGTLSLEVNNKDIQQLLSANAYNPTCQYVCGYLLINKGYLLLTIPILGKGSQKIKIPCIEGVFKTLNK